MVICGVLKMVKKEDFYLGIFSIIIVIIKCTYNYSTFYALEEIPSLGIWLLISNIGLVICISIKLYKFFQRRSETKDS